SHGTETPGRKRRGPLRSARVGQAGVRLGRHEGEPRRRTVERTVENPKHAQAEQEADVIDLGTRRQVYAEDIQTCFNIRSDRLVAALAAVPREQFLPPGPWTIVGEGDYRSGGRPRATPDADPRHVYHNVSIALDPA